jgi:uncharacterized membrane protein YphA (DoxX/SURF4 family)
MADLKIRFAAFLAQGTYPHDTYPWMAPILRNVVLPHARVCAFLTGYGEFLIGLGLIFGVLTRVASVFGILLMLLLWLSAEYPGPHDKPNLASGASKWWTWQ